MDIPPRRITQNDVAKAAGVNRATVSLALRKHPGIPEKTRNRIVKLAAKLGYVPDPMLSALASYRNSKRPGSFRGTLAWFAETASDYRWRDVPQFTTYLASAERAAGRLGYQVEVFDVSQMGVSWERAAGIAQARGIRGILVCPQAHADTHLDKFPWDRFSAVTFGYSLTRPLLHAVTAAHYASVRRIMRELHARGYRRIGLAVRPEHDRRIDHIFLAGFLTSGHLLPSLSLLPVCPDDGHVDGPQGANAACGNQLRTWLKRFKPDAIITGTPTAFHLLNRWGIATPQEMGIACTCISQNYVASKSGDALARRRTPPAAPDAARPNADLAGMVEDDARIGEVAVDLLVGMIQRGERGIPEKPQRVVVSSYWHEGSTLRARPDC